MSRQLCQILWKTRVARCAAIALLAAGCGFAQTTATEPEQLTSATLPQFLAEYEKTLTSVAAAFSDLEKQKLPLFDESGRPLGRRNIQDRSKELVELRTDIERLRAKPGDLVLIMTFFNDNERLADEVYDLSQIAYDNDQEELGKQLADLLASLDRDQDRIQAYALKVAATKEQRIEALEQENRDLQDRSKKSGGVRSGAAHSSQGDAER
jgi:hypothetical protein